jgi:hypothetical protein
LILVLGIDSRKFTEGQRDALAAFKKGKEGAIDFGKTVQEQGENISGALGMARKGVLGLVGAFIGGEAAAFIGHVVAMDAATGRMATSMGTSVQNLSTWQYMVKQVGGEASSATSALNAMQQELNNIKFGNKMPEGGLSSFANQAGINLMSDDADTVYRKAQAWMAGQIAGGKMDRGKAATFLGYLPGMNQDMINLIIDPLFKKIEENAKAAGTATGDTATAAQKLVAQFSLITQAMERFGASMIPVIDLLMKPLNAITGADLKKVFPGTNDMFTRDGPMDRLDRMIWGDHNLDDAKKRLADGLRGQASGSGGSGGGEGAGGDLAPLLAALAAGESGGRKDPYATIGPMSGRHGRAIGKYQVMEDNIGPWSKEALGRSYTTDEFLNDHDAQEKVAALKFGQLVKKYGPDGAARAWLAGEGGMNDPSRRDAFGTNVQEYQRRFDKALGARGTAGSRAPASSTNNTSSSEVHIGSLYVNAPKADDADGIASDLGGALKRQAAINPINNALV